MRTCATSFQRLDLAWNENVDGHGAFGVRWHERRLIGDVNKDDRFDSQDLVSIFAAGYYEEERLGVATFETGDFNGDGVFDSADLVVAFQVGHSQS